MKYNAKARIETPAGRVEYPVYPRKHGLRAELAPETVDWKQSVREADDLSDEYARRADLVALLAQDRGLPERIVDVGLVGHALYLGLLKEVADCDILYVSVEVTTDE